MLNSRATAAQADPEALHQAVAVIDMVLADLDAGRISADTAAKTIGLKVLTAREAVLAALRAPQNDGAAASEWRPIESARRHDRHRDGSTNQPSVIGTDGRRVGEARHWDGDWYWARTGERVALTAWQTLPAPPALAQPDPSQEPGTGGER
ncbi:hypothetical protein [Methylobacterium mesophilicum]